MNHAPLNIRPLSPLPKEGTAGVAPPDIRTPPEPGEASLASLALRLVAALLRVAWRCAEKVLSVGDCNVH